MKDVTNYLSNVDLNPEQMKFTVNLSWYELVGLVHLAKDNPRYTSLQNIVEEGERILSNAHKRSNKNS